MNAEDEVEALAALHATTDVMLQERAAAELELLQEAVRAGANVDWCVGTVHYTLSGEGERNPSWTLESGDKRWRECSKTTSHRHPRQEHSPAAP